MKFGEKFGVGAKNGTGGSTTSVRGQGYEQIFNSNFTKYMQKLTQTSYCSACFEEFQFLIQFPHNLVHNGFHGTSDSNATLSNMEDTRISAYDPIFYMHHNFVDRQYAYYQAVQKARGRNVIHPEDPEMPPFSNISPSQGASSDVPNPYQITQVHSKPNSGLNYETIFKYKYDNLLFKGVEPRDFDTITQCMINKTSVGIHFRASKPSRFKIYAKKEEKSVKVGEYAVLTPTESNLLLEYDVTSELEEAGIEPNDKTLHFEIESYDLEGIKFEGAFKPTAE